MKKEDKDLGPVAHACISMILQNIKENGLGKTLEELREACKYPIPYMQELYDEMVSSCAVTDMKFKLLAGMMDLFNKGKEGEEWKSR